MHLPAFFSRLTRRHPAPSSPKSQNSQGNSAAAHQAASANAATEASATAAATVVQAADPAVVAGDPVMQTGSAATQLASGSDQSSAFTDSPQQPTASLALVPTSATHMESHVPTSMGSVPSLASSSQTGTPAPATGKSLSGGAIAGAVFGVLIFICLVGAIATPLYKRFRDRHDGRQRLDDEKTFLADGRNPDSLPQSTPTPTSSIPQIATFESSPTAVQSTAPTIKDVARPIPAAVVNANAPSNPFESPVEKPAYTGPPMDNVHRVQFNFKPTVADELEINPGQLVRILQEYSDGWALCVRLDGSQKGVVPRNCLSAQPFKPRPAKGNRTPGHASPGRASPGLASGRASPSHASPGRVSPRMGPPSNGPRFAQPPRPPHSGSARSSPTPNSQPRPPFNN